MIGISWLCLVLEAVSVSSIDVCFNGFVMDNYCIARGTLFDNAAVVTLEGPEKHSIHCLVDVPLCFNSPFELLADKLPGETEHARAYQLDDDGRTLAIELARAEGEKSACSTCTGGGGSKKKGFRATVYGTHDGTGSPTLLTVTNITTDTEKCPPTPTPPWHLPQHLRPHSSALQLPTSTPHTHPAPTSLFRPRQVPQRQRGA